VESIEEEYKVARRLLRISSIKEVDISGGRSVKSLYS